MPLLMKICGSTSAIWEPPASGSRYLFLDEPVSSLDIHYQHQFLRIARELVTENILLIAVIHDLNLALQYADRILCMKEGRDQERERRAREREER